jgi:hypothetical protein
MTFIITKFSDLLKQLTTIPNFQRLLNHQHLESIIDKYEKTFHKHKKINYYGAIILCEYNEKKYLIDGQHRFYALKHMYEKYNLDTNIILQIIFCNSNQEMKEHFKNINSNLELPDYILELENDEKKQILQQLEQYLIKEYKNYYSKSQHPKFPNVNFVLWTNSFYQNKILEKENLKLDDLIKFIEEENKMMEEYFKKNDTERYESIIKKSNKPFFLSTLFQKKHKKTKISSKLRNDVWNTYIGKEIGISKCFCCKLNTIEKGTSIYHCGHYISEKNGGKTNIENLRPICSDCNLSMSIYNMDEFMNINGY